MAERLAFFGEKPPTSLSRSVLDLFEQYRPTEHAQVFTDIDFGTYLDTGVTTLLLDAEGTIADYNSWDVDPNVAQTVQELRTREQNPLQHVAIITNKRPKDERSYLMLAWWAHQIGAEIVFTPQEQYERKPSPNLLFKALSYFDISPEQALMIRDKATSDIKAANIAGVASIWLRRYGEGDVMGDRYIRRPIEDLWRSFEPIIYDETHEVDSIQTHSLLMNALQEQEEEQAEIYEFRRDRKADSLHDVLKYSNKIAGYGKAPTVDLPDGMQDLIPDSLHNSLMNAAREILLKDTGPFRRFMYEHGNTIADVLTDSRVVFGVVIAGLISAGEYRMAHLFHTLAIATDFVDGPISRLGKNGGSKAGGKRDQKADKWFTALIDAALSFKVKKYAKHTLTRVLRDYGFMNAFLRPKYEDEGIDTSAIPPSKRSTAFTMLAQNLLLHSLAQGNTDMNELPQYMATAYKIYSAAVSPRQWRWRHEAKIYDQEMMAHVKEQLAQRTTGQVA